MGMGVSSRFTYTAAHEQGLMSYFRRVRTEIVCMTKHIGIVSVTDEGTALCYRTICREGALMMGEYQYPQMTIHTFPLVEYIPLMSRLDWAGLAELLLRSGEIVARAGADFIICPCNTAHEAFSYFRDRSPVPWLHIVEVVADAAAAQGMSKVGILGTSSLMEGNLYGGILSERGIKSVTPNTDQREKVNSFIYDELIHGKFERSTKEYFRGVVGDLAQQGCDGVVMGCTEIPLILDPQDVELPLLDSTRLLAKAALHEALREH